MATRTLPTVRERFENASTSTKVGLAIGAVVVVAFLVVFFTFERQIFEWINPAVTYIRNSSGGMWVLVAIMFATCIFPLFGYGVVSMVCGYIFGFPKGFLPAFIGDMLGASAGFWLYRYFFHGYIRRKLKDNIEFTEMSKAVSKDGIWILFLIRLSSFPFAILNAFFGAMTQLPYWKFIVPLLLSSPRLFLPVFIGHNISSLADPTIKGNDRVIKWASNIIGIILALAVGYYIYRHTNKRIARINAGLAADENGTEEEREQEQQEYQRVLNGYQQTPTFFAPPPPPPPQYMNSSQHDYRQQGEEYAVPMEDLETYHHQGSPTSYQPLHGS
ncbi:Tlg2-vesicle protein, partial [Gryganskiella cystojenkinii]